MTATVRSLRIGQPGAAPVVVLHGLFGCGANWKAIAQALGEGADVHLLDLPNHGAAGWMDPMTYPALAADVAAWCDAEGLEAPILVGHSMGGKVAMTLALSFPHRVRALAVLDIAPSVSPDMDSSARLIRVMASLPLGDIQSRREAQGRLAEFVDEVRLRGFLLQNLERGPDDTSGGSYRWRLNLPVLGESLADLKGFPPFGDAATYGGPVLFLRGANSAYVSQGDRPLIQRFFPKARVVSLKGAGHWLNADAPDGTARVLRAFIEQNGGVQDLDRVNS